MASTLPSAGILDFAGASEDLAAAVHASRTGHVPGGGTAKVVARGRPFVVARASVAPSYDADAAGTVVAADADGVVVTCGNGALRIEAVEELDGTKVALETLGLRVGDRLDQPDATSRAALEVTETNRVRDESFWLTRLTRAPSASLLSELERRTTAGPRVRRSSALRVDVQDLRAFARRIDVDPAVIVLAAFLGYTARTARAAELAVAYRGPEIERRSAERPRLGAPWVPLVIDTKQGETFVSFVRRVSEEVTHLEARGDYRLDLVGRTPDLRKESVPRWLETVGVVLGGAGDAAAGGPPLVLRIDRDGSASVEFDIGHFDASLAELLVERLGVRLVAAMQRPEATRADLPVMTEDERRKVLFDWNATEAPTPRGLVHELFVARAASAPDAIAVIETGRKPLTYEELDRRSNAVARWLRAGGLTRGGHVGVWIERSCDLVVAMLGILKAGGIYVPLERRWPGRRIASIANGLSMRFLVTKAANDAAISELRPGAPTLRDVLYVDRDLDGESSGDDRGPLAEISETDVAYIIFTSGSTGEPKGVVETHRAAVNLITWVNQTFSVGQNDRLLFVTSPCFDLSIYDVFGTLAAGGSIRVASEEEVADPTTLLRIMRDEGITFWDSAPAVLLQLAAFFEKSDAALRLVFLSGDWVPVSLPDRVREAFPRARVIALGGATEATVWSNFFPVREVDLSWRSIPYGRPITNAQYYVLDDALEPCPIGLAGDLYIGGECLALGYTDPILTAGKFVPDPYRRVPGARLYRTGDRARFLADGNIEFLGRLDNQVKVRGYRIELGEIEAAMRAHPSVREAFGHVRERGSREDKELVAYVVPRSGETVDPAELRKLAKERLPEYMVPSAFVLLDALPLTPNGKVDRKALPAPDFSEAASAYVAPRTEVEAKLAAVFADVLRLPRVGIHDNFFALGGDSIATMRVIAVARLQDVHLSIKDVFAAPTVAELAERAGTSARTLPAEQGLVEGAFTLSPIYRWFLDPAPADPHHFNQSLLLRLPKQVTADALRDALDALARHHDALRLRFRKEDGGWRARFDGEPSRSFPLDVHDLRSHEAAARARIIEERCAEAEASFDLPEGPIARAVLFESGDEPARLFLAIHHFAIDGVSWRILADDLQTLLAGGRLPEKTTSFKAWTERLATFASSDEAKAHLGFWLAQAEPWKEAAQLPASTSSHGMAKAVRVALDEEHTRALLTSALLPYRLRVDEALLTAFARALARLDGAATHAVTLESHGRDMPFDELDVSRTVGWFTSMHPVLLTARHDISVADALVAVKEQVRSFVPHGPSWFLLRYLGDDAIAKTLPEPRILFNYLGQQMSGGFDAVLEPSDTFAPDQRLSHSLIVDSIVASGKWVATLTYDPEAISPAKAEKLGADFVDELRAVVVHALSTDAGALTPSDVSSVRLDQATLDRVTTKAAGGRGAAADVYALAPLQEGVLYHHLLSPRDDSYVIQGMFTLNPGVDVDALEQAFQALVDRHETLRTSFVWEGLPQPLQVVHHSARFVLDRVDWTDVPASEVDARLRTFIAENRRRGFDLHSCPLIRASVMRLADGSAHLVWTKHHAAMDGWSLALLRRELFVIYGHLTNKMPLELAAPVRFRAFIDRLALRSPEEARDDERFFRAMLAGVEEPTLLDPAPSGDTTAWAETSHTLPAELFDAVAALARTLRVTVSTVVHAAFAAVLARYTGMRDVIFGSITSGRSAPVRGVESIVGPLINAVPVRVRVADASVSEWLVSLQDTFNELRSHEHVPLTTVREWSSIRKGEPLFEALLAIENYAVGDDAARDLGFVPSGFVERTHYPVTLMVVAPGDTIRFVLSYDLRRFADTAVPHFLEHLETALRFIVQSPSARSADVRVLSDVEKAELLVRSSGARAEYESERTVHELVEEQARRTPDAIAVEFEDTRLSYAGLDERAERIARWLAARGAGPGRRVAISLPRSANMVAAVLGVLKAGAAYVPIDPRYPEDRKQFMRDDAGCVAELTEAALAEALAAPAANRGRERVRSEDLAYVLYTSGSTGRPKGVMVEHRNVVNLVRAMLRDPGMASTDVELALTTLSFDVAGAEIYVPLAAGARIVVASEETARDPRLLAELITRTGANTAGATPATWRMLVADGWRPGPDMHIHTAGEALPRDLAAALLERGAKLYNLYGPTEAAIYATGTRIEVGDAITIGRPIANTATYVLDRNMEPVPMGVAGELYIAGSNVARGYNGRPELTAEKFVPDPFSERAGARMYATGDLARWLPNRTLDYLGRNDHQVKVRGFRIELGEIEAAIASRPDVRAAVVVAREHTPGDKRLVAYLVGTNIDVATMRMELGQSLPDYMVPSAFVVLDALPVTPSGKVDRKALPAPDLSAAGEEYVAPRDESEQVLATIYREVLGVPRVGIHDNFFELGGHSLLATQVITRANAALHRELTVRALLEHPTIAELAAALDTATLEEGEI